jgi:hypothetical protein
VKPYSPRVAAPLLPTIAIGGYLAWRFYRRVRRNIGKQKLQPGRIIASLCILSMFSVGILYFGVTLHNTNVLLSFGGGLALGAGLGLIGLRLTRFETTETGHFYTPNTHIGIALSALLAARVIYRYMFFNPSMTAAQGNNPLQIFSPLTCLIIGLTFGYYIVYYIGLFVHTHDRKPDIAS